jgi:hypothetical protein
VWCAIDLDAALRWLQARLGGQWFVYDAHRLAPGGARSGGAAGSAAAVVVPNDALSTKYGEMAGRVFGNAWRRPSEYNISRLTSAGLPYGRQPATIISGALNGAGMEAAGSRRCRRCSRAAGDAARATYRNRCGRGPRRWGC